MSVVFPDPMLAAVTYLRTALAARSETVADGALVGTRLPTDGQLPYVSVRLQGASLDYRIAETASLRVTVWHTSEARALALAQLCRALLLAHPGDSDVRNYSPGTGPFPAADPDNGDALASFTVAARMRPTTI